METRVKPTMASHQIPRRPHGSKYNNFNLPQTVPIIGLGCSSFSTFFLPPKDLETSACVDSKQQPQSLTTESLEKSNPLVKEWISTIRHAILNRGITLLDTSPWYGHGISELVIGYALEDILRQEENTETPTTDGSITAENKKAHNPPSCHPNENDNANPSSTIDRRCLIINTKIGRYEADPILQFDFSYSKTISSAKLSIARMRCTYIDVLQLHDPEFSPSISILLEETIPAMLHCRDELKIVKALGITGYPLDVQHEILSKTLEGRTEGVVFDQALTYGHFNLHDTSLFIEPITIDGCLPSSPVSPSPDDTSYSFAEYCRKNSIPMMAAAPLSMGLLKNTPPPSWHPASHALLISCQRASEIASNDVSLASLATLFALSHLDISCTLIGMSTIEEVDRACDVAIRFAYMSGWDKRESATGHQQNTIGNDQRNRDRKLVLESDISPILHEILTDKEYEVLQKIRDELNGPFTDVWKSGEYRWDGKKEARTFWNNILESKNKVVNEGVRASELIGNN